MFSFVVPDIKYNTFETPLLEKHIQEISIEDFTMNFKHSFDDQPATAYLPILPH